MTRDEALGFAFYVAFKNHIAMNQANMEQLRMAWDGTNTAQSWRNLGTGIKTRYIEAVPKLFEEYQNLIKAGEVSSE